MVKKNKRKLQPNSKRLLLAGLDFFYDLLLLISAALWSLIVYSAQNNHDFEFLMILVSLTTLLALLFRVFAPEVFKKFGWI